MIEEIIIRATWLDEQELIKRISLIILVKSEIMITH